MRYSNIHYDKEVDALYISLKEGKEAFFEEIEPNVVIEYNTQKKPIGIEILNASHILQRLTPRKPTQKVHAKSKIHKAYPLSS